MPYRILKFVHKLLYRSWVFFVGRFLLFARLHLQPTAEKEIDL